MPELPEVEIFRQGIRPYVEGQKVSKVIARVQQLGGFALAEVVSNLTGQIVQSIDRRGKYLLFRCPTGSAVLHLGMTGLLQVLATALRPTQHDHLDIVLASGKRVRLNDPRRFSSFVWAPLDSTQHEPLRRHGPEPSDKKFSGKYLFQKSRGRILTVRQFIMESSVVAGVGNIYANEALFRAGIRPLRRAGALSLIRYDRLAKAIQTVLNQSIRLGGTMVDFRNGTVQPGRFSRHLKVYRKAQKPCVVCGSLIQQGKIAQRSYYYCRQCQK